MRRLLLFVLMLSVVSASSVAAQTLALTGLWQRVDPAVVGAADDLAPEWEQLTIGATSVTLQRSAQAKRTEVYTADAVERAVSRTAGQGRTCRAQWTASTFELVCHQADTGPGGAAPAIDTKEVRYLDDSGQLIVDLTWISGATRVQRHAVYRRAK